LVKLARSRQTPKRLGTGGGSQAATETDERNERGDKGGGKPGNRYIHPTTSFLYIDKDKATEKFF